MPKDPTNTTVRLDPQLRERIRKAMLADGYKNATDFHRGALLDKCRATEMRLAREHPDDYRKIYGKKPPVPFDIK